MPVVRPVNSRTDPFMLTSNTAPSNFATEKVIQEEQAQLRLLGPTQRITRQLLGYFLVSIFCIVLGLGGGSALMGRLYNPNVVPADAHNGQMSGAGQLMGVYLLVYFGTLGIMMAANLIPSLVVLALPRPVHVAALVTLPALTCVPGARIVW